jgi:dihydroflavonol-4-reductase
MRILLTGATGFLGAYVLRHFLQKKYTVRATRRADSRMDLVADVADQAEWVEADVTDLVALEDALCDVTHVVHCAALVSFHPRDARRLHQINAEGTANLVNLSLEAGHIERFVHVSSIAALGRDKLRPHLDERSTWVTGKHNTRYAVSKYLGEQEVWRGQVEGLTTAIVNPAMIVGSGFWAEGTARFFTQIADGLRFCPPGRTGFVDVRDVARFIGLLLESDLSEQRYVLSGENLTYRQFFDQIAAAIDVPAPAIGVTPLLAEVAWRVEWLREKLLGGTPMVTRESARTSLGQFTYGNEKSLAAFGDQFAYTPISQTIAEMGAQFETARTSGLRASMLPM